MVSGEGKMTISNYLKAAFFTGACLISSSSFAYLLTDGITEVGEVDQILSSTYLDNSSDAAEAALLGIEEDQLFKIEEDALDLQAVDCSPAGVSDCDDSVIAQFLGDGVVGDLFVVKVGNLAGGKPNPSVPNTFVVENSALGEWAVVSLIDLIGEDLFDKMLGDSTLEALLADGENFKISHYAAAVPEPSTMLLMVTGLLGLGFASKKKKQA